MIQPNAVRHCLDVLFGQASRRAAFAFLCTANTGVDTGLEMVAGHGLDSSDKKIDVRTFSPQKKANDQNSSQAPYPRRLDRPFLAARASDVPFMRLLYELGADPHATNIDGSTPLLAAAGVGALGDGDDTAGTEMEAIEAVRLLLEWGADLNAVDVHGETVMHGAAYQSRAELVLELAQRGASSAIWNRQNTWGWTPLMIAQGHRPGNFRPAPQTILAIEKCLTGR